jgi:hypothetical protein
VSRSTARLAREAPAGCEDALARQHLRDGTLVLYDVSLSYGEGRCCELAQRGYNRDGKKGRELLWSRPRAHDDTMQVNRRLGLVSSSDVRGREMNGRVGWITPSRRPFCSVSLRSIMSRSTGAGSASR